MSYLDRDAARDVLVRRFGKNAGDGIVLDALEGCVRPAPAQTIDHDALLEALSDTGDPTEPDAHDRYARVLALLQPVNNTNI